LEENEGYFDTLQATHGELADRLAGVDKDYAEILIERAGDAQLLQDAYDETVDMRDAISRRKDEKAEVERANVELQQRLQMLEDEIKCLTLSQQECQTTQVEETERAQAGHSILEQNLRIKDERISELEDLLRAGLQTEGKIRNLSGMIKTRDERILELECRQTERQRQLDENDNMLSDKETEIASLSSKLHELEEGKVKLEKDCEAAIRSISAKDTIIGVLRDKLGTAAFEKDELVAERQMLAADGEQRQKAVEVEVQRLRSELELVKQGHEEAQAERKEAVEELKRVQEEMKLGSKVLDEKKEALLEVEEAIARLEDERVAWEEEREEVSLVEHRAVRLTVADFSFFIAFTSRLPTQKTLRQCKSSLRLLCTTFRNSDESSATLVNSSTRHAPRSILAPPLLGLKMLSSSICGQLLSRLKNRQNTSAKDTLAWRKKQNDKFCPSSPSWKISPLSLRIASRQWVMR
jgi:chromosome segregation ATPase